MRQLRLAINTLCHTITKVEVNSNIPAPVRDEILDGLYRDLNAVRASLRSMERAA